MNQQNIYNKLQSLGDLSKRDDNFFRNLGGELGVDFGRGRQDAYDFIGRYKQDNPSPEELQRKQIALARELNQPAVQALEGQRPIIKQATEQRGTELQAAKTTLGQRYTNIIDTLKGRSEQDVSRSDLDVSREYGKRGILPSSGVVGQVQTGKANPIRQYYSGAITEAGVGGAEAEQEILNQVARLPIEEAEKLNIIQQAIAQLEAGASREAIQNSLAIYSQQQQDRQFQADLGLRTREADSMAKLRDAQIAAYKDENKDPYANFLSLGEGETLFDLNSLQSIFKNPKTFKSSSGGEAEDYG